MNVYGQAHEHSEAVITFQDKREIFKFIWLLIKSLFFKKNRNTFFANDGEGFDLYTVHDDKFPNHYVLQGVEFLSGEEYLYKRRMRK